MSGHDTISPEIDDQLRTRLQAFAQDVAGRIDTEAALDRMPRHARRPSLAILAIAACLLVLVVVAAAVPTGGERFDPAAPTTDPECLTTTQTTDPGGPTMTKLFRIPAATAAALVLLGACGDDGPTTLAKGDVAFDGGDGFGKQTLDIDAVEEDGKVSGEARIGDDAVITLDCGEEASDGVVVVGGEVTGPSGGELVGDRLYLVLREGDPDSGALHGADGFGSCAEVAESDVLDDESMFHEVAEGDDLEIG